MQTEQVVFTSICVYIHIYAITISKKKKEAVSLMQSVERYMGRRKGEEKYCN